MKLSEVIAELENGSTATYEAYYRDGTRVTMSVDWGFPNFHRYNPDGKPYEQGSVEGNFSENCDLELDWSPVKTSVKWEVAIREWSLGKEVHCEVNGCRYSSYRDGFSITPEMVSHGVWYVEDEINRLRKDNDNE